MTASGDVFEKGRFVPDRWSLAADGEVLPEGAVFVSKARFLAERESLAGRAAPIGVVLEPADRLDDLIADLPRLAAIAIRFPVYTDGRGYSLARLLRDRHGYTGELRAIGDILWDQVAAFLRVGFDGLTIVHEPTRARLAAGETPTQPVYYQPGAEQGAGTVPGRPWLRVPDREARSGR